MSTVKNWIGSLPLSKLNPMAPLASNPVGISNRQRLLKEFGRLEGLDRQRACLRDPSFGRAIEMKIIWRELLDLELQEVDEHIERICQAHGACGPVPDWTS